MRPKLGKFTEWNNFSLPPHKPCTERTEHLAPEARFHHFSLAFFSRGTKRNLRGCFGKKSTSLLLIRRRLSARPSRSASDSRSSSTNRRKLIHGFSKLFWARKFLLSSRRLPIFPRLRTLSQRFNYSFRFSGDRRALNSHTRRIHFQCKYLRRS